MFEKFKLWMWFAMISMTQVVHALDLNNFKETNGAGNKTIGGQFQKAAAEANQIGNAIGIFFTLAGIISFFLILLKAKKEKQQRDEIGNGTVVGLVISIIMTAVPTVVGYGLNTLVQ